MKIYFDTDAFPNVDDLAPIAAPVAPARRHGLRNWHKFLLCYVPCMAGGALILYGISGLLTAVTGLLIWLATVVVILAFAGMKGRL